MRLPRLENSQVKDRRALVRADFEELLDSQGAVQNPLALEQLRPTVELLRSRGASVLIAGHCGDPGNEASSFLTLQPVAVALGERLGVPVRAAKLDEVGELQAGEVVLLENLLQYDGEAANSADFAKRLAGLADVYVNDAFGASRRELASIVRLPKLLPSYTGLALFQEAESLDLLLQRERRPLTLIVGGVRLDRKLKFMSRFMERTVKICICGGVAYTFLRSRAVQTGASFVERDLEVPAFQLVEKAELAETVFLLPEDHVVAEQMTADARTKTVARGAIPDRWRALDIGPKTVSRFEKAVKASGSVFWYGPAGAIELQKFAKGSESLAKSLAKAKAYRIVGGADTANLVYRLGLADKFDHVSASGASALDYLMGAELPGLKALAIQDSEDD